MMRGFNKRGATLAELIVTMSLSALLAATAAAVIFPFIGEYRQMTALTRQETLADILIAEIRTQFNDASYPRVITDSGYGTDIGDSGESLAFQNVSLGGGTSIAYIITDSRLDEGDGYLSVRYLREEDLDGYYIGEDGLNGLKYYYYGAPETVINTAWLETVGAGLNDNGEIREFALGTGAYMGNTVKTSFTLLADCVRVELTLTNIDLSEVITVRTEYIDFQ